MISDTTMIKIMESDSTFQSNDLQAGFISSGASLLVLSGEGDYIVPWKSMWDQFMRNWTFEGKEEFAKQPWQKFKETDSDGKENTTWYSKKHKNFEWRRIVQGGHLISKELPKLHVDVVTEFLNSHY